MTSATSGIRVRVPSLLEVLSYWQLIFEDSRFYGSCCGLHFRHLPVRRINRVAGWKARGSPHVVRILLHASLWFVAVFVWLDSRLLPCARLCSCWSVAVPYCSRFVLLCCRL